jgi:broad specificity phosphatase PhoE
MATAYYFTHTQIRVDPTTPVPDWCLSDEGRARIIRVTSAPWMTKVGKIIASPERRTVEAADIFARRCGLPVEVNTGIADTDRPRDEYLSVADLDSAVDTFLARPDESARPGWETANDGQKRVAAAVDALLAAKTDPDDILFIGHGRIGTLLMCHLAGLPLSREHFQPTPGGNLFAFDCATRKMVFRWRVVAPPL